jgi:hypothetical protein
MLASLYLGLLANTTPGLPMSRNTVCRTPDITHHLKITGCSKLAHHFAPTGRIRTNCTEGIIGSDLQLIPGYPVSYPDLAQPAWPSRHKDCRFLVNGHQNASIIRSFAAADMMMSLVYLILYTACQHRPIHSYKEP